MPRIKAHMFKGRPIYSTQHLQRLQLPFLKFAGVQWYIRGMSEFRLRDRAHHSYNMMCNKAKPGAYKPRMVTGFRG